MKLLKKVASKAAKVVRKSNNDRMDQEERQSPTNLSEQELEAVLAESELQAAIAESEAFTRAEALARAAFDNVPWQTINDRSGAVHETSPFATDLWEVKGRRNSTRLVDELDKEEIELALALEQSLLEESARRDAQYWSAAVHGDERHAIDPIAIQQQDAKVDIWSRVALGPAIQEDRFSQPSSSLDTKRHLNSSESSNPHSSYKSVQQASRDAGRAPIPIGKSSQTRPPAMVMQQLVLPSPIIAGDVRAAIFRAERSLNTSISGVYDLCSPARLLSPQHSMLDIKDVRGSSTFDLHAGNSHTEQPQLHRPVAAHIQDPRQHRIISSSDVISDSDAGSGWDYGECVQSAQAYPAGQNDFAMQSFSEMSHVWQECWSKTYRRKYYFNKVTGEYQWECPVQFVPREHFKTTHEIRHKTDFTKTGESSMAQNGGEGWDYDGNHRDVGDITPLAVEQGVPVANSKWPVGSLAVEQGVPVVNRKWAPALMSTNSSPQGTQSDTGAGGGWDYSGPEAAIVDTAASAANEAQLRQNERIEMKSSSARDRSLGTTTLRTENNISMPESIDLQDKDDGEGWA